ncbi:MAG TPA: methyltransferase domain-containing protein [Bryobacteraceae bacterium]|nr:methyltransferase domain-containing protein [Bryobacteraceae bacterium]
MRKFAALVLLCWPALAAQVASEANTRYQTHEGRMQVAQGLDGSNRAATQRPEELVRAMDLKPGMAVADVGTGVGFMLPYLSKAVGPSGRVIAEDIFDDFLTAATERAQRDRLQNITFIKGLEDDPHLPGGILDVVLALDSYHHYNYPQKMLAGFIRALKPGGRLVIVEYHKTPDAMPGGQAMHHIRLDQAGLIQEVEASGFRLLSKHDHIPGKQYMAIFARP